MFYLNFIFIIQKRFIYLQSVKKNKKVTVWLLEVHDTALLRSANLLVPSLSETPTSLGLPVGYRHHQIKHITHPLYHRPRH